MSSNDERPGSAGAEAEGGDDRVAAARALLAAIDARVFPQARPIPFYEQSVLIKRAVTRLFGDG